VDAIDTGTDENARTYDAKAVGGVLRRVRLAAGLSQEGLARESDLHPTYISLLERGRATPTLRAIWAIAPAVGLRPSEFIALVERDQRRV